jgi:hypothetical protein
MSKHTALQSPHGSDRSDTDRSDDEKPKVEQQPMQKGRETSVTKTFDRSSIADTDTIRSHSTTDSHTSEAPSVTSHDTVNVTKTTNTNIKNARTATPDTITSQKQASGSTPVIRPSVPPPQQQKSHTSTGVTNQPVKVNPALANQQARSTSSSSVGSLERSGNTSVQQQPRPDVNRATLNQSTASHGSSASQQGAQTGNQASGQFNYQQQQKTEFANRTSGQQVYNELLGPDAFKDVILNIDYGAIEAYNMAMQAPDDFTAGQASGNNQAGGGRFDVAKAIFNQVDTNRDGRISREEFQRWGQGATQNFSGQSNVSYQTTTTTANNGNNFNQAQLFSGATPDVANILRQSGLGNYG